MRGTKGYQEAPEELARPDLGVATDDLALSLACLPVHAADSVESCLYLCLQQLDEIVAYDAASIGLVREDALVAAAARGLTSGQAAPPPVSLHDHPLFAKMTASGQPERGVAEAGAPGNGGAPWLLLPDGAPIRAWLAVPLLSGGRALGQLAIGAKDLGAYGPQECRRVAAFAAHVAVALRNSGALAEERRHATLLELQSRYLHKLLEALRELSTELDPPTLYHRLVDWAMETVPEVEGGCLFIREGAQMLCKAVIGRADPDMLGLAVPADRLARATVSDCPVVRLEGRPLSEALLVNEPDLAGPGRTQSATLIAPVCLGKEMLLGALYLGNWRAREAFTDTAVELARLFAAQAAIVISNARLYRVVREYTNTLEQRVSERTAQIREAKDRSEAILHSVADGVVVTDLEGQIVEANPVASAWLDLRFGGRVAPNARLYAFIRQIATGQLPQGENVVDFVTWPEGPAAKVAAADCVACAGAAERVESLPCWMDAAGSQALDRGESCDQMARLPKTYLQAHAAPIAQDDEPATGMVIVLRDISKMRELDDLKSQFVSNVSHELRTPLSNIKLYLSLVARGRSDKRARYLRILEDETNRLSRLIEDLLDLSRLETGQVRVTREEQRWERIIPQVLDTYQPQIEGRRLTVHVDLSPEALPIWAGRDQLIQVLTNLLSNAFNYTDPRGEIWVSTDSVTEGEQSYTRLIVRDTGIGIPEADRERIFDRFYRGMAEDLGIPGTGLGLTIVKEIVESYDGRIEVQSQIGEGSCFIVYLPSCRRTEMAVGTPEGRGVC